MLMYQNGHDQAVSLDEWRQVCAEQDKEYEESLLIDRQKDEKAKKKMVMLICFHEM